MKRLCIGVLVILALWLTPSWGGTFTKTVTLNAQTTNATGTPVQAPGFSTAVFQVCCGSFTGTVSFLASLDGFNFEPLGCWPITANAYTASLVTTATARGMWRCDVEGVNLFVRADLSGYGGGTVTVIVTLTTR